MDVERRLREKSGAIVLKPLETGCIEKLLISVRTAA